MRRDVKIGLAVIAGLLLCLALAAGAMIYGARTGAKPFSIHLALPPPAGEVGLPSIKGPLDPSRPLVVIDAGHGGFDPGAGSGSPKEKEITLALAKALEAELLANGGIRVAMTRESDRYLLLPERSGIARRLKADLFISIHADSAGDSQARGATIYTLSDRGSNETAARLAEAENRADTVNGVQLAGQDDAVNAILVDLSQREALAQSVDFANLILREGEGAIGFRERSMQSAAFVVLKSADLPSVLFEAGYISNPVDAARLASPAGRKAFAEVTARAIKAYFARHQTN